MRRIIAFPIIALICIITTNCSDIFTNQDDNKLKVIRNLTSSEIELKESSNQFGLTLFGKIAETEANENTFISPLSVSMALGMTYNGADSTTLEAMHETLGYGDLTIQEVNESYLSLITLLTDIDPDVIFDIANSIWCREGFYVENSFISTNQNYFDALVQSLDFSRSDAADIINTWVSDNTNGKIEEIVTPPIDISTIMFLINAIYFKGSWTYEFDPENTVTTHFFLTDNSQIDCRMMSYKCEHSYFANDQFQAVDLPYGDGNFRMMIILPYSNIDIDGFIADIDNATWNTWLNQLEKTEINLYLPKFKLEYKNELNNELSAMGMEIAFDPTNADFSGINPDIQLYISKVKHKTFIDVNEEGTEAAAVTSVEIDFTSIGDGDLTPTMRVDHPFIFAIHEINTGTILFIGKIVKPEYKN